MRFFMKFIFTKFPRHEPALTRSITNNVDKYCFCSYSTLQKKKETISESRSTDSLTEELPPRPKRPPSCFIRFVSSIEFKLLQNNPKLLRREITVQAAELWKKLDNESKLQFRIEYYNNLAEFYKENEKYNAGLTEEQMKALRSSEMRRREHRLRKRFKDKFKEFEKPKRPLNAFTSFMVSKKDDLKNIKANVYCHQLVEDWNKLSERQKNKFRRKAKVDQIEYQKKLAEWKERVGSTYIRRIMKTKNYKKSMKLSGEKSAENPKFL